MATATNKGLTLAASLQPSMGTTREINTICSDICRLATEYARHAEELCNGFQDWQGNWDQARTEKTEARQEAIEKRIAGLCLNLPLVNGEFVRPIFGGDPRGCTVKLVLGDGRTDDWAREGICVPGA